MNYDVINRRKKELGLTNVQLADRAGVTLSTLEKITSGINRNPKLDTLRAIATAIGCTLNDFDEDIPAMPVLDRRTLRAAESYAALDVWGKQAVDAVISAESARVKAEPEAEAAVQSAGVRPVIRLNAPGEARTYKPMGHSRRGQYLRAGILPKNKLTGNDRRVRARFSGSSAPEDKPDTLYMRVYDHPAAAGDPMYEAASPVPHTVVCLPAADIPPRAKYGVRISGHSMEPSVPHGGIVWVEPTSSAEAGDIVVAWIDGEGTVCKRVELDKSGSIARLLSDNPGYPGIEGNALENMKIYGVVRGIACPEEE